MTVQLDKQDELTEDKVCRLIARRLPNGYIFMPRFTPRGWWECDVCGVTPSDYWVEYEVKLTRADFMRDRQKGGLAIDGDSGMKWDLLASKKRGPSRFYYVVREGIVTADEVPAWAGMIVVEWVVAWSGKGAWCLREVREAPRRRNEKDAQIRADIFRCAYYRFEHKLR